MTFHKSSMVECLFYLAGRRLTYDETNLVRQLDMKQCNLKPKAQGYRTAQAHLLSDVRIICAEVWQREMREDRRSSDMSGLHILKERVI